jgi:hypothetical protein
LDALQFVMRRASRYWQVLVVLALGVVLATALLASAPVLTNTVIEFGMRRALLDADPAQGNVRLATRSDPDLAQYRRLDAAVSELVRAHFSGELDTVIRSGDARWMYPWVEGELRIERRVRLSFYGSLPSAVGEGLPEYARLVSGQWPIAEVDSSPKADRHPPDSFPPASQAGPIPVAIGQEMAAAYGLAVGDRLGLGVREEASEPELWIEVAGIVRARAGYERYWFGAYSPLLRQQSAHYESQYSVLVAPETLFALASSSFCAWPAERDPVWLPAHRCAQPGRLWDTLLPDHAAAQQDVRGASSAGPIATATVRDGLARASGAHCIRTGAGHRAGPATEPGDAAWTAA